MTPPVIRIDTSIGIRSRASSGRVRGRNTATKATRNITSNSGMKAVALPVR